MASHSQGPKAKTKMEAKKKLMKHLLVSFEKACKTDEAGLIRQASGRDSKQMNQTEYNTWQHALKETSNQLRRWAGESRIGETNPYVKKPRKNETS